MLRRPFTHGMCVLDDPSDSELRFEAAQQAETFRQGAKRLVIVVDVSFQPGVRLVAGLAGTDPVVLASLTQSQSTGRAMSCPGGFAAVTIPGA